MVNFIRLFFQILLVICVAFHRSQQQQVGCGRSESGSEAGLGEFPWMVHLLIRQNYKGELFSCSGTLISDSHVLTAGHCVHSESKLNNISITLGLGGTRADGNWKQHVDWKKITIPAGFENVIENDIAIITLTKPANLTDYVQPICLPSANTYDYVNDSVVLTGWVQSNYSTTSSNLFKINTTVISSLGTNGQCQEKAGIGPFSGDRVICTQAPSYYHHVGGGGPMNFYHKKLDQWFILGVAGKNDVSTDGQRSRAILFTRVTSQLNFLRKHTGVKPPYVNDHTETTTTEITTSTHEPQIFNCTDKPDGNYPNPASNCSTTFYMCSGGQLFTFNCSANLVYRHDKGNCDWKDTVAGCNS